ncbi:MAG: PIG-L deacetylase family protein, partial [Acidimicrobiales bacterium]
LEYGAASAVARWSAMGKEVSYVLATSGEAGIDGMAPAEAGPVREEEERLSAAAVGVSHVEFLGLPDGILENGLPLRRGLAGALRRLRPDIVVGMNFDLTWGDSATVNHADHRVVGLAVLDACRDAANRWVFPNQGQPWDGIRAAYISGGNNSTHYVDVGATIGLGVASLRAHRLYIEGLGREFDPDSFLHTLAEFAGVAAGCDLAVLFQRYGVG